MKENNDLLLVIDMQEGFRFDNVTNLTSAISRSCEHFTGRVMFACFKNEKGSRFERELGWRNFQSPADQEVLEELRHLEFDCLWHSGLGILNESFQDYYRIEGVEKVFVAGVYLDVSVIKFCMDCFDSDIHCKILSDCVTAQSSINDDRYLASLSRVIGDSNIISSSDLV